VVYGPGQRIVSDVLEKYKRTSKFDMVSDFMAEFPEAALSLGIVARISTSEERMQLKEKLADIAQPLLGERYNNR
jgi:hypothetical protein